MPFDRSSAAPSAVRRVVRPPCSGPDADPLRATGRTLRWGVVATGTIARQVSDQLVLLEDAQVHAVSSRDAGRARTFADRLGAPRAYGDEDGVPGFVRLAEDPDVDVAHIATPNAHHHAIARSLIDAGKHVLLEKTFTLSAAEADDLVSAARRSGTFLMEAVWTRFLPVYQAVLDVLERGEIGEVHWVRSDLGFAATFDRSSRLWARDAGGGALLDLMVYPWTWALGALGTPQHLTALGTMAPNGVDATTSLQLGYPDGGQAQLLGSLAAHATRTVTIAGSHGTVRTAPPVPNPDGFTVATNANVREVRLETNAPYTFQLREVTRCVQQGLVESPTMPLSDTVAMMRAFDEARERIGLRFD